jgi:hypothetical protein
MMTAIRPPFSGAGRWGGAAGREAWAESRSGSGRVTPTSAGAWGWTSDAPADGRCGRALDASGFEGRQVARTMKSETAQRVRKTKAKRAFAFGMEAILTPERQL